MHRASSGRSAMLASFLSRVMPALCTTTSTPPCLVLQVVGDPLRRVLGGDVERRGGRRRARSITRLELAGGLRHVDADDGRAVAVEHPGDLLADAAAGAGHQRDLARPAALSSRRPAPASVVPVRADPDDLARDVRRLGREQEGERATPPRPRRPSATYTSWTVPPRPISLPSERVKPSRARCATRSLPATGSGGGAEHHDARRRFEAAHQRGEELAAARPARAEVGDAGGVEDQALVRRRPRPRSSVRRRCRGRRAGRGVDRSARRPVPPTTTVPSTSGRALGVPLERGGVGQAEVLDEQLADGAGREAW